MELDVRPLPRSHRRQAIVDAFRALAPGEDLTLVTDEDPSDFREQFDVDFARSFTWTNEEQSRKEWRVRLAKTARTPLPQVLANTRELSAAADAPDRTGAVWKLSMAPRDLDSNLIALAPHSRIHSHTGPDLDVMFIVVDGRGEIATELDAIGIEAGDIVWLPRRSVREVVAGASGLRYLTVHVHKTGLQIGSV